MIDFETDQAKVITKTENIRSLADQVERLEQLQKDIELREENLKNLKKKAESMYQMIKWQHAPLRKDLLNDSALYWRRSGSGRSFNAPRTRFDRQFTGLPLRGLVGARRNISALRQHSADCEHSTNGS